MKMHNVFLCLLVTGWSLTPSRAQDAAPEKQKAPAVPTDSEKQPAAKDAAMSKDKEQDKEAVPREVVPEKEAIKQLVGDYRIVSGQNSGEEVLPERLEDVTVRFTEKTVTTYDGEKNQRFSAIYRLDTQQRPWRIKMTSTAKPAGATANSATPTSTTSDGLIEMAAGRVRIIYALPGGLTPESFRTGERQQMFVMEQLPDPTEKPKRSAEASSSAKENENEKEKQKAKEKESTDKR